MLDDKTKSNDFIIKHGMHTKGGVRGHIIRRLIHILAAIFPIIYYYWGESLAQWVGLTPPTIILIILGIILFFEMLRLVFGVTVFGQRQHESRQISSFAWDAMGIILVLLFAPGKQFGIPIIWGCAFGDPFIGELKRLQLPGFVVFILGVIFISLIWLLCYWLFATPLWLVWIMGLLTTLAEWPNIPWLDDNITMQLIPLLIVQWLYK